MINYTAIVLAAGQGKRMKAGRNKQFLLLDDKPLIIHTLSVFETDEWCKEIILVINENEQQSMQSLVKSYSFNTNIRFAEGGKERQDSVYEGLRYVSDKSIPVFIHDGARPFVEHQHLHELAEMTKQHEAALLAVPVTDTIKQRDDNKLKTLERSSLWAAQTPQSFSYPLILQAHEQAKAAGYYGTDDASLVERMGKDVVVVQGSYDNMKLTTPEDKMKAQSQLTKYNQTGDEEMFRIGQGFDVHQLAEGRKCIIGGVEIPHTKGLLGHSDADVLLHTVADACLGAIGEGDIGKHFPDTDEAFKDADSSQLLQQVWSLVQEKGYQLGNLDCTVIAQAPKMAPYIKEIRENIAALLATDMARINVKATTTEKLGFPGRGEGIAAQAVVLLQNDN
ncbi:bifunctional 2-C-methyl-D-erythritol 4-phosphate cytidylyltransferase/2-C-methyl-D-erythritol 2,4-cyclodiphosphate synthase [Halobacillus sp. MO56]